MNALTDLEARIQRLPRVSLAHLPTPLERLKRFSESLGGPQVWIKRDDCTGLAMGGNKTRHNEFLMADAVEEGADLVVWGAGVQSNNCRQTAASCARLGIDCHLLLSRGEHVAEIQGNLLLDHILGASYEIVDEPIGPQLDERITSTAAFFREQGRNVYSWDRKTVKAKAAISYSQCLIETTRQLQSEEIEPAALYICSGGSTGAGLALARKTLRLPYPVHNILPIHWPWDEKQDLSQIANESAKLLDLPVSVSPEEISIDGSYVGEGYGIPTPECMEAVQLLARTEGILLDPSYTGKAMAGLIDHVRAGRYSASQHLVFVHTGGTPALFANRDALVTMLSQRERPT